MLACPYSGRNTPSSLPRLPEMRRGDAEMEMQVVNAVHSARASWMFVRLVAKRLSFGSAVESFEFQ